MVVDATLRCLTPEVHDIGIVPIREYTGIRQVCRYKIARPEAVALFLAPCPVAIARQAMDEDETAVSV